MNIIIKLYFKLSIKTRFKIAIILGKIAKFIINLPPKCPCGCKSNVDISQWTILGFDIKDFSEMSIILEDNITIFKVLPSPGYPKTYPKI